MSGNREEEWSNVAVSHDEVEWHTSHVSGKPDAAWGGVVVRVYFAWWHEAQAVAFP